MEYPTAMTFEVYTPFLLPDELFKGFNVTSEHKSYIRNGLGIPMNSYKDIPKSLIMYNNHLKNIASDMDVKVLSVKPICIYSKDFVEHIDFEVVVNRYSITPTESLTYEMFYDFVKNINEILSRIKDHSLKDFFVRTGVEDTFYRYGFRISDDIFITLPDVYIPVTDIDINERHILDVIRYMDGLKDYYHQYYDRSIKVSNYSEPIINAQVQDESKEEIA